MTNKQKFFNLLKGLENQYRRDQEHQAKLHAIYGEDAEIPMHDVDGLVVPVVEVMCSLCGMDDGEAMETIYHFMYACDFGDINGAEGGHIRSAEDLWQILNIGKQAEEIASRFREFDYLAGVSLNENTESFQSEIDQNRKFHDENIYVTEARLRVPDLSESKHLLLSVILHYQEWSKFNSANNIVGDFELLLSILDGNYRIGLKQPVESSTEIDHFENRFLDEDFSFDNMRARICDRNNRKVQNESLISHLKLCIEKLDHLHTELGPAPAMNNLIELIVHYCHLIKRTNDDR